ncbi:MAG: hypothetical protein KGL63_14845 [Betaproteobacteria bacterium]|nr:hypothetical protein [Betaproteobacteria bacterium]
MSDQSTDPPAAAPVSSGLTARQRTYEIWAANLLLAFLCALFADATAKASYDAVYPRTPITVTNPDGTTTTVTPPERFGQMG